MRSLFAVTLIVALTACGGGGGGGTSPAGVPNTPSSSTSGAATPAPSPSPGTTTTTATGFGTPQFSIVIPAPSSQVTSQSLGSRKPNYVSPGTLSISIELTQVNGSSPGTLPNNPAITNISPTGCSGGCTISGPPSPVGSDTFLVRTYPAVNAGGSLLDTATATFMISQGMNSGETLVLEGVPASFTLALGSTLTAGSASSTALSLAAKDAAGNVITGTYANAVTIADPDTNGDGSRVSGSCSGVSYPTGNTAIAATSVNMTASGSTAVLCYGGLAENPVTLTASAAGATSGTVAFAPARTGPVYVGGSGIPSSVVIGTAPPDVALSTTSGTGSTGQVTFAESGWTNAPYDLALSATAGTCSQAGPLATFAAVSSAPAASGTTFTVTTSGADSPGICSVTVSDGTANTTGTFTVSYTATTFTLEGHARQNH